MVKKGQVLFVLRNTDLEVNISDVTGKLASTSEQRRIGRTLVARRPAFDQ